MMLLKTIALTLLASTLAAQDLLWRAEGVGGFIGRGLDLHRIGDFNADGWEDLIETTAAIGPGPIGPHPRVSMRITSGLDGSTLSAGMPIPSYWNVSNMAPLGDMDQDGYSDRQETSSAAVSGTPRMHCR